MAEFLSDLGPGQRDLVLTYVGNTTPDPMRAVVLLDGAPGTYRSDLSSGPAVGSFTWDPVPTMPSLLEFRYDDGPDEVYVDLVFVDFACEQANPRDCDDEG